MGKFITAERNVVKSIVGHAVNKPNMADSLNYEIRSLDPPIV
jgi:hypothetical protein